MGLRRWSREQLSNLHFQLCLWIQITGLQVQLAAGFSVCHWHINPSRPEERFCFCVPNLQWWHQYPSVIQAWNFRDHLVSLLLLGIFYSQSLWALFPFYLCTLLYMHHADTLLFAMVATSVLRPCVPGLINHPAFPALRTSLCDSSS